MYGSTHTRSVPIPCPTLPRVSISRCIRASATYNIYMQTPCVCAIHGCSMLALFHPCTRATADLSDRSSPRRRAHCMVFVRAQPAGQHAAAASDDVAVSAAPHPHVVVQRLGHRLPRHRAPHEQSLSRRTGRQSGRGSECEGLWVTRGNGL